ncbi:E3 ubiquitin-protein ligase RAD18 [Aulostomus maculatus]
MELKIEADLPPALASLKSFDTLLRCPICFDFLSISMMTKCSHNFCSLCIRRFFSYKLQCPVCNIQATEQDLRNNRLLDELVVNFQAARQKLSKVHFDSPPMSPKTPASVVKRKTPRDRGQKSNSSTLTHFFQMKPKTSPTKDTQQDGLAACYVHLGKLATARTHNANDTDLLSVNTQPPVKVKEEPMDVGESLDSGHQSAHSSSPSKDIKPVIKVPCPVCSVNVSQQFINKHLDVCLSRGEKMESLRSSISKARRPMAKVVYNLLSLQELKRRLKECHLSVQGSREQMIKRHKEFFHLYNAQCDSLNPKSAEEIAKEVEANEKMRNQLQGRAKPVVVISKTATETEIDEWQSNYRKQHSSDFSRLIAQVRGRLDTARQTQVKEEVIDEGRGAHETHSTESKSCIDIKVEEAEVDEEPSVRGVLLSSSPTSSDVSISSSLSDIFGPEPTSDYELTDKVGVRNQASSSRDSKAAASPSVRKRRRT